MTAAACGSLARRLGRRIEDTILPFWSTEGFDQTLGLFHERVGLDGAPDRAVPRRAMVQARQIHVFSEAARHGLVPGGADLVGRAVHSLLDRFCDRDDGAAGFAFSLDPGGTVGSAVRDSYAHAFLLFGFAGAYRLTGEPRLRRVCERTLGFVDRHLTDTVHGGLYDRHPDPSPEKSQNPQMHLLEACLALHEAFPDGSHLERAGAIVGRLVGRMIDPGVGLLPERFGADWSLHADPAAHTFEPGHHFEWLWLVDRYCRLSGTEPSPSLDPLWTSACRYGLSDTGLLFDEVGFDGRPTRPGHRLWPHAEGAKAAAVRFAAGDAEAVSVAATMLGALDRSFTGRPFAGGWVDRIGPDGEARVDCVPASSLYHLYGAWAEADRVFGARDAAPDP